MNSITRNAALGVAVVVAFPAFALGRSPFQAGQTKEPSGSISGRVTLADRPAPGVTVMLASDDNNATGEKPTARTTTGVDGRFQLTGVPAGRYVLQTYAPAFVGPSDRITLRWGKSISLAEGEAIEDMDIALTRGGVITGKVTGPDGHPLIQESVRLFAVDERGQKQPVYLPYPSPTDDRGVFRLYGVPPGRYIVSVRWDTSTGSPRRGSESRYYTQTYYPDAPDQSKATVIEVTAGSEASGIDITLGRAARAYAASGRIVSGDTGKPVAGMRYGYGSLDPGGRGFSSFATPGSTSGPNGEFRLEGILPGSYAAFASTVDQAEQYSDSAMFQLTDGDVTGLEIKVRRGSSLSGVVIVEGGSVQAVPPPLSDVHMAVSVLAQPVAGPHFVRINLGPDGSFRTAGLPPGKATFHISDTPKGFCFLRVERNGVELQGGVDVGAGEQISGVKVVLGYGTGVIRGQINVQGGVLPEGARIFVDCRRLAVSEGVGGPSPFPDSRGRFACEGLIPGEYEVIATAVSIRTADGQRGSITAKQTVSVTSGTESPVTLVLDLNAKR